MVELKLPKGMRDFDPEEKILRNKIITILKNTFEKYGYNPIETSLIERQDVLASKYAGGAEILKETFKLNDQGNRKLMLRYDLTVPFARYVGMNKNLKMPFKRYDIAPVFRDGPIKLGRYRQFYQCDVDVVGAKSNYFEIEIFNLALDVFSKLNIDIRIDFNSIKILKDLIKFCGIDEQVSNTIILSIDKLKKIGRKGVIAELIEKGFEEKLANKVLNVFEIKGNNVEKLEQLKKIIPESDGIKEVETIINRFNETKLNFDITLARGLTYYTGLIYEIYDITKVITSSIGAGGRWDNMIGEFIEQDRKYPTIGISFGLAPIIEILKNKNKKLKRSVVDVFVIPINTLEKSFEIITKLRREYVLKNINFDIDLNGKPFSKNLKWINDVNIKYALIIGENEIESNKFKLKDMFEGSERELSYKELIEFLKNIKK